MIDRIVQAWNSVISVFSIGYVLEFLAFVCLIYFVCSVLKENKAIKIIWFYVAILIYTAAICLFLPKYGAIVYLFIVLGVSAFLLLLFSIEIKRGMWAKTNRTATTKDVKVVERPETEACIEAIIKACQNMSKNDVGALIVLSGGNVPKTVVDSGTYINADISQPMIEGIFFPKSPLHDGALIVEDHKLLAAGCFLPLTQKNEQYEQELGTRHRAGIGITEVTNVTVIIVSEESGIISIVKQGKITRYADYAMLRRELQAYYWKDFTTSEHTHGKRSFRS